MSETNNRNLRNYSKYDSMSTEQLQEILRLDAHQNEGNGMDTEELFYIMEVLTVRRKSNPETTGKPVQEARRDFRKHYLPKENTENAPASKSRMVFPTWLRRVATVAAVLAIFMVITTSVNAFGYDLWGKVAVWSQEFFHFEDETQGTEGSEPDMTIPLEYTSLQDALTDFGITQKLAPQWLPDGYTLHDLSILDSPREISISAKYKKDDKDILISIRQLIGSEPEEIEKSENFILAYDANGVTYYIFNNYDKLYAAWVFGEFECYITGTITMDEMKSIINSI